MTIEELQQGIEKLMQYAQEVSRMLPNKGNTAPQSTQAMAHAQRAQQPQPSQQNPNTPQQSQHPQLNAANLQKKQEELHRKHFSDMQKYAHLKAPAAPTVSHPPVNLGAQSPSGHGVPQYNLSRKELTQDKLQLPPSKRRKPNNQGQSTVGTPAQTPGSQTSPQSKVESPVITKITAPTAIKCQAANCKASPFQTKTQLDKHVKESHPPKVDHITDPVGYVLESLRIALNLDDNGAPKSTEGKNTQEFGSVAMSKTLTSALQDTVVKKESSTPMARTVQELRTPQNVKSSPVPDSKVPAESIKNQQSLTSWANSPLPRQWFAEVFRDVTNLNRRNPNESLTDWFDATAFSSPGSPPNLVDDKSSPHKSDISATDNLNIAIGTGGTIPNKGTTTTLGTILPDARTDSVNGESWLPSEWFDDLGSSDMVTLDVDGFIDMDWETSFGQDENNAGTKTESKRRNESDPSDEFLKAWAPEKIADRTIKKEGAASVAPAAAVGGGGGGIKGR